MIIFGDHDLIISPLVNKFSTLLLQLEISKLRSTDHHPYDAKIDDFDSVLVRDILRNVSSRPHYIQDKFTDLPNCSDVEAVKRINSNLDLENTFSKFKSFHKKPCANFAMTYQQKFKVPSFYIK